MPGRHTRRLLAIAAALAATTALAACGGDDSPDTSDIPEDAVAMVGDKPISKADFDRWLINTAKIQHLPAVPDAPRFAKCTATARKQFPKGTPKPAQKDLVAQCQATYDQLRSSTMSFLIQAESAIQDAEELDLVVTAEDVRKKLQDFKVGLKNSGLSEEDYIYQQRVQILQGEVPTQVRANAGTEVSDDEAQDYYDEHKDEEFQRPETRTTMVLTSDTKAKAARAKKRLDAGDEWAEVAADLASPTMPGASAMGYTSTQTDKLSVAAFKAKEDKITGPVRTESGWAVLQVQAITPSGTIPFDEAKGTIIPKLQSERESEAATKHQEEAREATVCREEYLVPTCGNMPEPEPTGTPPATEGE